MTSTFMRRFFHAAAATLFAVGSAAIAQETPTTPAPPPGPTLEEKQQQLDRIFDEAREINKLAQASQEQIDDLSRQNSELVAEYDRLQKQLEGIRAYNAQQRRIIAEQEQEIREYEQSIIDVQAVRRQIIPLMLRMIKGLEEFLEYDLPFNMDQRQERVAGLRDLLDRSDVSEPNKFRRVFEVYQIENDFGRTIDSYSGSVTLNGAETSVDFVRIGRIVLAWVTKDGQRVGFYNPVTRQYEELGQEYRSAINNALRYANRQASAEIYAMPIEGPETVR